MRLLPLAALLLAGTAPPALAQEAGVNQRVDRLEREMRAVQRKVFPGGSQQYLEPQIGAPATPTPAPVDNGASSPVADLTTRVSSLEQELARLTGQIEQNGYRLRQMDEQFARFKADAETRLNTLEGGTPAIGAGTGAVVRPGAGTFGAAAGAAAPAPARTGTAAGPPPFGPAGRAPATSAAAPPALAEAPPEAAPVSTGDAGEDAYLAGYRLWEQKKYVEAAASLRATVEKYPNHRRASYAQNLLGRAYLDDGQPAKAAEAFYANYQKMPRGERAPDSLYYLGQSLMALKPAKSADACKVYAELIDVYGEKIAQPLKDRVAKGRADAKCGA
jgi:TolA-binding protein